MEETNEVWKKVIIGGKVFEQYEVSQTGKVRKWDNKKETWRYLKIGNRVWKERGNRQDVCIKHKTRHVHKVVAETFLSIDDNPPVPKEDWDKTPESVRELVKSTMLIDHIDDNPFNNHVSNLRWVTPKQNNSHVKAKEMGKREDVTEQQKINN